MDQWIESYNTERTDSGKYCYGKTPVQTFLDAKYLADAKMIQKAYSGREPSIAPSPLYAASYLSDQVLTITHPPLNYCIVSGADAIASKVLPPYTLKVTVPAPRQVPDGISPAAEIILFSNGLNRITLDAKTVSTPQADMNVISTSYLTFWPEQFDTPPKIPKLAPPAVAVDWPS